LRIELVDVDIEKVREALRSLGYRGYIRHEGFPSEHDVWRRGRYHVTLCPGKNRVTLKMHRDPQFHGIGPITRKGPNLKQELRRILKALKGGRA